jgi:DNA-binding XRE family transcriptional regulator
MINYVNISVNRNFLESVNTIRGKIEKGSVYMNIGEFLKFIRNRHSLTQSDIGNICLRSKDWVYMVENGKLEPTNEDLALISKELQEPLLLLITYGKTIQQLFKI